jgi:hypothetical protein
MELGADESMICAANMTVTAGQYSNVGTVTGTPSVGANVEAADPSHYYGSDPGITIEKLTNGQDADELPGPTFLTGTLVTWTYRVTNTGNVTLTAVAVIDDQGVTVVCPQSSLAMSETMTCTAGMTATVGQYGNVGTVTGTPPVGDVVSAADPSHYFGSDPSITIEKLTNGEDADELPGPTILVGTPVTWTYVVINTGNVTLIEVTVTDDQGVTVICPQDSLAASETMTCTANMTATAGQYSNVGTVWGTPLDGLDQVSDSDPSHYLGTVARIALPLVMR